MVLIIFWVAYIYTTVAMLTAVLMYPHVQESWLATDTSDHLKFWDHAMTTTLAVILGFAWPFFLVRLIKKVRENVRS